WHFAGYDPLDRPTALVIRRVRQTAVLAGWPVVIWAAAHRSPRTVHTLLLIAGHSATVEIEMTASTTLTCLTATIEHRRRGQLRPNRVEDTFSFRQTPSFKCGTSHEKSLQQVARGRIRQRQIASH